MKNRCFISDCNDTIVGNPKGYLTLKRADIQANKPGSKAYAQIWDAYDKAKAQNPEHQAVYSIRYFDAP